MIDFYQLATDAAAGIIGTGPFPPLLRLYVCSTQPKWIVQPIEDAPPMRAVMAAWLTPENTASVEALRDALLAGKCCV